MEVDGVSLTMGGAAVSAIAGVVGAWIKAKYGKPVVPPVPQPLETERVGPFVTCGECKQHRAAIGKRIDGIEATSGAIPFIEKVAANTEAIENIKRLAFNSTIGGKK